MARSAREPSAVQAPTVSGSSFRERLVALAAEHEDLEARYESLVADHDVLRSRLEEAEHRAEEASSQAEEARSRAEAAERDLRPLAREASPSQELAAWPSPVGDGFEGGSKREANGQSLDRPARLERPTGADDLDGSLPAKPSTEDVAEDADPLGIAALPSQASPAQGKASAPHTDALAIRHSAAGREPRGAIGAPAGASRGGRARGEEERSESGSESGSSSGSESDEEGSQGGGSQGKRQKRRRRHHRRHGGSPKGHRRQRRRRHEGGRGRSRSRRGGRASPARLTEAGRGRDGSGRFGSGSHSNDLDVFIQKNQLEARVAGALRSMSEAAQKKVMGTDGGQNSYVLIDRVKNPNGVVMSRVRKIEAEMGGR
mmetsp:Transcript_117230/g.250522  ORF Transcript_117230/g.250522 Transcript_117230/m.250522 type:complete len:373 (-) Transcript_117230:106-1224(-)